MTNYSLIPQSDLDNLQKGLDSLHNILKISLASEIFDQEESIKILDNFEQLQELTINLRIKAMA